MLNVNNKFSNKVKIVYNTIDSEKITITILSKDYDFLYCRFDKCFGDTETLIKDFFKESVENNIEAMKDLSNFRKEIALPKATMKKINAMLYYYETINGEYNPISLDKFIILMVDKLYEIKKKSYKETGEKISKIVEKVIT